MASYTFRPLVAWPGERRASHQQTRARFDSTWGQTLDLLSRELDHINAKDVVIQLDCDPKDITRDNTPRSTARPRTAGVVLSFVREFYDPKTRAATRPPFSFPCDRFDDWQDNVRAIALSLEALRKVDRYGVTKRGEQYIGFGQLPASTGNGAMTPLQAAEFLSTFNAYPVGHILASPKDARDAVRGAAAQSHPDTPGGSAATFQRVQDAKAVLSKHHGVSL